MKDKKYIIISPLFPSDKSHVGSYVYDQAKALVDVTNYDISIIKVVSFFNFQSDYKFKGINVKIFKVLDFPFFIFPGIFHWINSFRIKRFFKTHKLDCNLEIIHAHVCYPSVYLANVISSIVNIKVIAQHHGIDALQLLNCRFNFFRNIQRRFLKKRSLLEINKAGLNVSVSERVRRELRSFKHYYPNTEYILYNGVDTTKFYNKKKLKHNNMYVIGCIANFWKIKNHISLIKALELIVLEGFYDINLRLIGSGRELYKCKKYVQDNNLTSYVQFENERSHKMINNFYNEIDLFVLPSYYEALGCVLMEAWATDTPILSIKNQGIEELIPKEEHQNLLADEKSPRSLKEKIMGEYNRRRNFPFNDKYNIQNTITDFIKSSFFQSDV